MEEKPKESFFTTRLPRDKVMVKSQGAIPPFPSHSRPPKMGSREEGRAYCWPTRSVLGQPYIIFQAMNHLQHHTESLVGRELQGKEAWRTNHVCGPTTGTFSLPPAPPPPIPLDPSRTGLFVFLVLVALKTLMWSVSLPPCLLFIESPFSLHLPVSKVSLGLFFSWVFLPLYGFFSVSICFFSPVPSLSEPCCVWENKAHGHPLHLGRTASIRIGSFFSMSQLERRDASHFLLMFLHSKSSLLV